MKYFVTSRELVSKQGEVIHRFSCPADKRWDQLMVVQNDEQEIKDQCRYCDRCDNHVFDISELDEVGVKSLLTDPVKSCLYIDFDRAAHIAPVYGSYELDPFYSARRLRPRQHAFCSEEMGASVVRVTRSISVMQQFLEQGYQLSVFSCLPKVSRSNKWLRVLDTEKKLEVITEPRLVNTETDYELPVAAYLVHSETRPGDEVKTTCQIDPLFSEDMYDNFFFNADMAEILQHDFVWDGSSVHLKDKKPLVNIATATELFQMQWALDHGYELKFETRLPADPNAQEPVTEWLRCNKKSRRVYTVQDKDRQNLELDNDEFELAMPAWAYIVPPDLEEGQRLWIRQVIGRFKEYKYGTRNGEPSFLCESDYITSADGRVKDGNILITHRPKVVVG